MVARLSTTKDVRSWNSRYRQCLMQQCGSFVARNGPAMSQSFTAVPFRAVRGSDVSGSNRHGRGLGRGGGPWCIGSHTHVSFTFVTPRGPWNPSIHCLPLLGGSCSHSVPSPFGGTDIRFCINLHLLWRVSGWRSGHGRHHQLRWAVARQGNKTWGGDYTVSGL